MVIVQLAGILVWGLVHAVFAQQVNIQVREQHHVMLVLLDLILFKNLLHVLFVPAGLIHHPQELQIYRLVCLVLPVNIQIQDPRNVVYAKRAPFRLQAQEVVRIALEANIQAQELGPVSHAHLDNTQSLGQLHVAFVQAVNILGLELNPV